MINRRIETIIQSLMRYYLKRNGLMCAQINFSYDNMDFVYAWVAHKHAKAVYNAMFETIQYERSRTSENSKAAY